MPNQLLYQSFRYLEIVVKDSLWSLFPTLAGSSFKKFERIYRLYITEHWESCKNDLVLTFNLGKRLLLVLSRYPCAILHRHLGEFLQGYSFFLKMIVPG